jgi:NAD(P)-dependent dehydrogenase (short-subunit alcohol dehydrogenase family)
VSFAVVSPVDDELVRGCLAGDEAAALKRAGALPPAEPFLAYASAKRALARWVRRTAPTESWAGAGIALNAVAPGIVRTPMTQSFLEDDTMRRTLEAMVPMPLGGITDAETVAESIVFLASPLAAAITGQVLFVDGGADCVRRGDDVWTSAG